MKFNEFKENVEHWATVRGIYEQSTEAHQQAKALEEIGEYITAENDKERMDAIGDIAVCIINAAKLNGENLKFKNFSYGKNEIGRCAENVIDSYYGLAMSNLNVCAIKYKYSLNECLQMAWDEIKNRKGMMINKKYVKWDNLTDEQKEEFNRRNGE